MMNALRKWSRILHRDIGFFFVGSTLLYGLSGIALNHLRDWNPSYSVQLNNFVTEIELDKSSVLKENILKLLDDIDNRDNYKKHYFPQSNYLKIFLKGGSSVEVNIETGEGTAEFLKKRPVFYQVNFLHYNPNWWWMWFSDIYAGALILFVITSLFMIRGKKGAWGRGGIYIILGIILPVLFLILI
ncbi:MAG: PepSY-associated TM helix domain-containing protein [Bacteroidota bacterium]